jgi:hypothetical protein
MGLFKQSKDMFQAVTSPELGELYQSSKGMERPSMLDGIRQANEVVGQTLQHQRLMQVGLEGRGRIDAARDTGTTVNEQALAELTMTVSLPGRAEYQVTTRQIVPRMLPGIFAPGSTVPVRVDPDDATVLMFDQTAYATQSTGSIPQPGGLPVQDPAVRLERLTDLRDRGLLTEGEFAAQKARILADL